MKHIKTNEEFINYPSNDDQIIEMATISDLSDIPYVIFVNGGNSYGSGRNEHGDPHFHFTDNIKGGKWQFSVLIPTVEEWKQSKELYISESSTGKFTWNGLKKEKKLLIEWLNSKNKNLKKYTNIEVIRFEWNTLNKDNKNVKQLSKITEED